MTVRVRGHSAFAPKRLHRKARGPLHPKAHAEKTIDQIDDRMVDESLQETFPASDPPSWEPLARLGAPKRKRDH
jgi:hypothetical protein